MKEHFDGLLQIAQAMDSFNLSNDAAIGLLKGNCFASSVTFMNILLCAYMVRSLVLQIW